MNKLRIAGGHYDRLRAHLYPGDNKEAVGVMLCGRSIHNGSLYIVGSGIISDPLRSLFRKGT